MDLSDDADTDADTTEDLKQQHQAPASPSGAGRGDVQEKSRLDSNNKHWDGSSSHLKLLAFVEGDALAQSPAADHPLASSPPPPETPLLPPATPSTFQPKPLQVPDLDIGSFTDPICSMEYCCRVLSAHLLLTGEPRQPICSDDLVRVTVKSLAISCLSAVVRLHPCCLLMPLIKACDGADASVDGQRVWDVMLLVAHSDPQLRSNVLLLISSSHVRPDTLLVFPVVRTAPCAVTGSDQEECRQRQTCCHTCCPN